MLLAREVETSWELVEAVELRQCIERPYKSEAAIGPVTESTVKYKSIGRSMSSLKNKPRSLGNLTADRDQTIIGYSEGFASKYIDPRIAVERAWTRF